MTQKIQPYIHEKNILVYCGAANVLKEEEDESETADEDLKQIHAVTDILGNELGMSVAKFTAEEPADERRTIKEEFSSGRLQAIVAIKCLDEGMNIPGIRTAFILASSTNPKEYIQRRGRVLRRSPGKKYAELFDFITLPRSLGNTSGMTMEEQTGERTLAINEVRRIKEFSSAALNSMDANSLMWRIQDAYHLTEKDIQGRGE